MPRREPTVYLLELAGQDDAFAVAEAATAVSDVSPVAAGLATARGLGDEFETLYEFEWQDGTTRTTDELGDFEEAGLDCSVDDVVDVARADDECEVRIIGFGGA